MERKCAVCGETFIIDENNSIKAIQYKKKFYHFDCFNDMCDKKITNSRKDVAANWAQIKNTISELVEETTQCQKILVHKDNLYQWLFKQYGISFLSTRMYMKFDDIYNGALKGLAYAIGPQELLTEWQYYWNELCDIRRNKNLTGETALNYDLAVVLGKNAEYRKIKEKERVAREVREQQKEEEKIDMCQIETVPAARQQMISSFIAEMDEISGE